MTLIKEIQIGISEKRKSGVSIKEVILFDYLERNPPPADLGPNPSSMDRICFSAFFHSDDNISEFVKKEQKQTPIKGLHYANNLIELLSMAKHDFAFEEEQLREYSRTGSLKESYLISVVFPDIPIQNEPKLSDPIDQLVHQVFIQGKYDDLGKMTDKAIEAASDLLEWWVIKKAVREAWSLHPDRDLETELNQFIALHQNLKSFHRKRIRLAYGALVVLLTSIAIFLIFYFIVKYWEALGLEPYLAAISISSAIISITFSIILYNIPSSRAIYDQFIEKRVSKKFSNRYRVNKPALDQIEQKHTIGT